MVKPLLIQSKAKWQDVLQDALDRTHQLEQADPSGSLPKLIRRQLEFMKTTIAAGRAPTPEEAARIDVGPIAVKNFEDTDPPYAEWLMELDYAFRRWSSLP
jgi:hypothetical protein